MPIPTELKKILGSANLKAKKRLGQNFLIDQKVITRMVSEADLSDNDVVLEIGPGLGALTTKLIQAAGRVIAVEKDQELSAYLSQNFKNKDNLELISQDIFRVNFSELRLKNLDYKIVANLPFYLTSHFLRFTLEHEIKPSLLTLLVQKEVAERITARAGDHSLLSLSVQFYGEPTLIAEVDKKSFYPAPEVNAALIKIRVFEQPRVPVDDVKKFFRLLRIGFSSRRKQLHNNLAAGLRKSNKEIKRRLQAVDVDPTRRAESLTLEEWRKLFNTDERLSRYTSENTSDFPSVEI